MMSTGEKSRFVHQSALWQSYQQSHLVANREDVGEEDYGFCLQNISFILAISFTCRKILRHGASGFASPQKEGVLRIFIALKIHRISRVRCREAWVQWQAH
jgi:hypothetical protein